MSNKKLVTYEATISLDNDSELMVDACAVVDNPAIKRAFLSFKEQKSKLAFASVNTEKRIVVGAAMIPNMLIYRNNELGEHNVYFSAETIEAIAEKFFATNMHQNANEMHDPSLPINGMVYFLSFIRNSSKTMTGLEGDYEEGTWFLGARVTDDEVWAKIQSGEYKGFSVEGLFGYKMKVKKTVDELALEVDNLMNCEELDIEEVEKLFLEINGTVLE